jgi:iron complex outermembrane receptor protein
MASVSLIVMALSSAPALAQAPAATPATPAADDASPAVTGDIVVEARRRDELAQDVPLVVNAVTAENLQKLNIRDLKDVTSVVPGLALSSRANGIGSSATLRGVNFDVNASGNNGTVEFYLDDAPISADNVLQSMFDVGQIEVLRGPQGTLRGRASPSGSITVTTRKPDLREWGGYGQSTLTDIGAFNLNGALNIPIIKDMLAIRVSGLLDDNRANQVHSINASDQNPYARTRSERVAVRFDPIDTIDIVGTYQHFVRNTRQFDQVESADLVAPNGTTTPLTAEDRAAVLNIPRLNRMAFDNFNLRGEWRFAGQKLNYVGNWIKTNWSARDPNDKGDYFGAGWPGNQNAVNDPFTTGFATVPNLQNAAQTTRNSNKQYSHELRLSSDERLLGIFDYVLGGMINRTDTPFNLWSQTPLFVSTPSLSFMGVPGLATPNLWANSNIVQSARTLERSLFGNVTAHIGDSTEISGGLRYINYKAYSSKTIQTGTVYIDGTFLGTRPAGPLGVTIDEEFNPVIYTASVKHRFNDNIMVYASTGSSWRASAQTNGIIDRDDLAPWGSMLDLLHLPPETSKSYEIGFKSDWLNKRLMLNLTYYHQDFKNYFYSSPGTIVAQRLSVAPGGDPSGPNAGDTFKIAVMDPALSVGVPVKVDGVEAEFAFRASRNWDLSGTVSYSISKIKNGLIPCNTQASQDALHGVITPGAFVAANGGQQFATCRVNYRAGVSAPFSASLQTEYRQPLNDVATGFVRALASIYGDSQNDPANPLDDIKGYALVNLYAGIRETHGNWELAAYVKNLFDTQRVLTRDANVWTTSAQVLQGASAVGFPATTNYRVITMTPPTEFGVTLRYAFGSR